LRDKFDVATYTKVIDSGIALTVVGEKDMASWPEIRQKMESLKGISEKYQPSNANFVKLVDVVFGKKELDLVVWIRFHDSCFSYLFFFFFSQCLCKRV
jgi:hypothetical protein